MNWMMSVVGLFREGLKRDGIEALGVLAEAQRSHNTQWDVER